MFFNFVALFTILVLKFSAFLHFQGFDKFLTNSESGVRIKSSVKKSLTTDGYSGGYHRESVICFRRPSGQYLSTSDTVLFCYLFQKKQDAEIRPRLFYPHGDIRQSVFEHCFPTKWGVHMMEMNFQTCSNTSF